jgi:hypothetical protein
MSALVQTSDGAMLLDCLRSCQLEGCATRSSTFSAKMFMEQKFRQRVKISAEKVVGKDKWHRSKLYIVSLSLDSRRSR